MELKREVAGTSRIEGADFTEGELDEAMRESPQQLVTRSQRQAHAAVQTYRWIARIPDDRPVDAALIQEVHRRIVTGADDDHCPPGVLRRPDENVNFGQPRHRGAEGGPEVADAFLHLVQAIGREFRDHDPIVQAIALHYHIAAMHPFLDGNGRTARALEALLLQRAGLRDIFVAMSNYYYEEKLGYLRALADTRTAEHDLTPFLAFALEGLALQGGRLLAEIRTEMQREVYRNLMHSLFTRLRSKRKRVVGKRQLQLLERLLAVDSIDWDRFYSDVIGHYGNLTNPQQAFIRDVISLMEIGAIRIDLESGRAFRIRAHLEWPTEITESEFFERIERMPHTKTYAFLRKR
jgi:Fic family protein